MNSPHCATHSFTAGVSQWRDAQPPSAILKEYCKRHELPEPMLGYALLGGWGHGMHIHIHLTSTSSSFVIIRETDVTVTLLNKAMQTFSSKTALPDVADTLVATHSSLYI